MEPTKKNLYQKITEITESLGLIQKDSKAPAIIGGYTFISHGAMLGHLRHELTSRNIVIRPSGEEVIKAEMYATPSGSDDKGNPRTKINFHSVIKFSFTVVDGDNPSDYFVDSWIGEGMDTNDKGVQKAGTSAEKYYLMKLFKVGDKDDPDAQAGSNDGVGSMSATINKPTTTAPVNTPTNTAPTVVQSIPTGEIRPAGSPGVLSQRMVEQLAKDANGEVTPEQYKAQQEALVWLGEQLPPSMQWFRGKIVALVSLWEQKKKNGTLTPEEAQSGSAINHLFSQLAEAHHKNCGDNCDHLLVPQLAIITGGKIVDPAKTT